MEGFLGLIGVYVLWFIVRSVFSGLFGSGGSTEEIGPFKARLNDFDLGDDSSKLPAKEIQVRGLLPIKRTVRAGFITSVFDCTGDEYDPVMSVLDAFQEPESVAFRHVTEVGRVSPDQGAAKWARVGVVIPNFLTPPYSGNRKFAVVVRLVDLDDPPSISLGRHEPDQPGLLWQSVLAFNHSHDGKGYLEAAEDTVEANALTLKIAMAVAMADGSLDDSEGEVLKEHASRMISPYSGERQQVLKQAFNSAMEEAYDAAKTGDISLSSLTQRLNEIGDRVAKYETIELCFEVMAADGVIDPNENLTIRRVAEALNLDFSEIEKIRDQKLVGQKVNFAQDANVEELLGIDSDWEPERIKKHLRIEFQKWNNRLNVLQEGGERDSAQRMLDLIAKTRQKYG